MSFEGLILSLVVTIVIYSLPIAIYRYAIRGRPVERKKAKIITIVYAIFAFIVMSLLVAALNGGTAGGAILLWSYVNYRMLVSVGTQKDETKSENRETPPEAAKDTAIQNAASQEIAYCSKCGAQLEEGWSVCRNCGANTSQT